MKNLPIKYYYQYGEELCEVLSIDMVNRSFYILPENELEGGSQVEICSKGFEVLMQLLGVKDKDGVEIYNNCYVKQDGYIFLITFDPKQLAFCKEVVYIYDNDKMFKNIMKYKNISHYDRFDKSNCSSMLVIGNIYNKPQELKNNVTKR